MLIGYTRVSTNEQDTATQVAALKTAGCERIFREKASGGRWNRPELHRLLDQLRKGDVLVVWKLDRLSQGRLYSRLQVRSPFAFAAGCFNDHGADSECEGRIQKFERSDRYHKPGRAHDAADARFVC